MKYCDECGTQNKKDVLFCVNCGNDLKKERINNNDKKIIYFIISFINLFFGTGIIFFLIMWTGVVVGFSRFYSYSTIFFILGPLYVVASVVFFLVSLIKLFVKK